MKSGIAKRLHHKTSLHAIQVELQSGYDLSPVEALVLARRVQQLVDEQAGFARQPGQITYQAIAIDEPPGKPLKDCRKAAVHLTVMADEDSGVWTDEGSLALRRLRVHRVVYEATLQGGALSQEDVACILGVSRKSIKRIFAYFREQGQWLPSRGQIQDMGRGVSHKIPIIRRYVEDLSFSQISRELGNHGIASMARYLNHFALVMILEDRGLTVQQMESVIGISENLIGQYRDLYAALNQPEHQRTLERLKRTVLQPSSRADTPNRAPSALDEGEKGGLR
jgi:hypothetical protein